MEFSRGKNLTWFFVILAVSAVMLFPAANAIAAEDGEEPKPSEDLEKKIEMLISDLNSDDFNVREAAEKELTRIGEAARPALKKALKSEADEVRWRVENILKKLDEKQEAKEQEEVEKERRVARNRRRPRTGPNAPDRMPPGFGSTITVIGSGTSTITVGDLGATFHSLSELLKEHLNLKAGGVAISRLRVNSLLKIFGLKNNDIIIEVNGDAAKAPSRLISLLRGLEDGEEVTVKFLRKGKGKTFVGSWGDEGKAETETPPDRPGPDSAEKPGTENEKPLKKEGSVEKTEKQPFGSDPTGSRSRELAEIQQLGIKAMELLQAGKLDEAIEAYKKLIAKSKEAEISGTLFAAYYYNLACAYALNGNKDEAFKALGESIENGYADFDHMKKDPDLDGLRADPRWKGVMEKKGGNKREKKVEKKKKRRYF